MERLSALLSTKSKSSIETAQQKSLVTYHLPVSNRDDKSIYIRESPRLLATSGTTGFRTWASCLHLAYYLSTSGKDLIFGKNVAELGAGTGMLSILCAGHLGARAVLATDGDSSVVDNIAFNATLNGLSTACRRDAGSALQVKKLDWTELDDLARTLIHDGRHIKYDVMLGSDITYSPDLLPLLCRTLTALLLHSPGADILVSTPIRNEATFAQFVTEAAGHSFTVKAVPFECPAYDQQTGFFHPDDPPRRIIRLRQVP